MIDGTDYLTGADGIPLSDLKIVEQSDTPPDSDVFADCSDDFAQFAGRFVQKYGVAETAKPPVVLSLESLAVVRSFYDRTGGDITAVYEQKARKSW